MPDETLADIQAQIDRIKRENPKWYHNKNGVARRILRLQRIIQGANGEHFNDDYLDLPRAIHSSAIA